MGRLPKELLTQNTTYSSVSAIWICIDRYVYVKCIRMLPAADTKWWILELGTMTSIFKRSNCVNAPRISKKKNMNTGFKWLLPKALLLNASADSILRWSKGKKKEKKKLLKNVKQWQAWQAHAAALLNELQKAFVPEKRKAADDRVSALHDWLCGRQHKEAWCWPGGSYIWPISSQPLPWLSTAPRACWNNIIRTCKCWGLPCSLPAQTHLFPDETSCVATAQVSL